MKYILTLCIILAAFACNAQTDSLSRLMDAGMDIFPVTPEMDSIVQDALKRYKESLHHPPMKPIKHRAKKRTAKVVYYQPGVCGGLTSYNTNVMIYAPVMGYPFTYSWELSIPSINWKELLKNIH